MSSRLVFKNFYNCDTEADLSLGWPDGTYANTNGATTIDGEGVVTVAPSKNWKKVAGAFVEILCAPSMSSPIELCEKHGTGAMSGGYDGNPATINQSSIHRFVTDAEKSAWNGKQNNLGFTPANSSHNHDASYAALNHVHVNQGYAINVQALTSSPADSATIYFGMLPKAPATAQGTSKIYLRAAGIIKRAEIYCFSGTAGSAEAWPISIRLNSSSDTLIQSLSLSTSERVFTNAALNIAVVAGDYIEIKSVNPAWATNPLTCIFGGYIYIE